MRSFQAGRSPHIFLDETSVFDIGSCIVDGIDIAPGRAIPDDGDARIDHSLEGFLFTCGPDHIRHPEPIDGDGEGRRYPLHGSFSSHPAKIVAFDVHETNALARVKVPVKLADGGTASLERTWRIDGESGEVSLEDRIVNTSDRPMPVFLMYHMNVGARLFDDAVRLEGAMLDGGGHGWRFGEEPGNVFCVPAGNDDWAELKLGPVAAIGGKTLTVRFSTETLPYLQMWRNQQEPANVLGIEPVSHRWVGRSELEAAGEFNIIQPGESRSFGLRFSIL
ncbi:aldose 1-epimerase family protein [Agrobacterium sp. O3.4]|uniref:Aldose 1-epimerase family protein n=1 Tax=Agrobacterium cucumeris TaxID=2862866 RepID=A0ABY8RJD4_9HYPH|nr:MULTISPECIES: aldose 1-epimerase family protein [Rhizobium/Agrobacterium group]MCZ7472050.1 aldose 1-epimerase family protein [Rhizobium rhizogenes]WHO07267.1 aldose 1-epimerase family protein [Agrobacterium cucumeris]